jgi:hypothetical protein
VINSGSVINAIMREINAILHVLHAAARIGGR